MKDVIEQSKQLNTRIKQSAEYRTDPIADYLTRLRNAIQAKQSGDIFDEMNALLREYDELLHNSIVSDFMNAEQRICKMMQQMYGELAEGLEFDY